MKIYSTPPTSPSADSVTPARTESAGGSSSKASSSSASSAVDLSPAARQLSNLQSSDHDVNVERVNEIRSAIAAGQLKVDPGRIADGLIASVRDLLK